MSKNNEMATQIILWVIKLLLNICEINRSPVMMLVDKMRNLLPTINDTVKCETWLRIHFTWCLSVLLELYSLQYAQFPH